MPKTKTRQGKALRAKSPQSKTRAQTARGKRAPASKTAAVKSAAQKVTGGKSSREKVSAHRKRMRAEGLRLVQMWLPDTRSPEFKQQAHRDALAKSATEADDQAFIDSVQRWTSKEPRTCGAANPRDGGRSRRIDTRRDLDRGRRCRLCRQAASRPAQSACGAVSWPYGIARSNH